MDESLERVCTGCGVHAPQTDTDYTLISSRFGWRVRRYVEGDEPITEWWCPACWAELKRTTDGPISSARPGRIRIAKKA